MWPHLSRPIRSITPIPLRRVGDPKHGSLAAYQRGCGCEDCRKANCKEQRRKRNGNSEWLST
jgi:hypothetical protein